MSSVMNGHSDTNGGSAASRWPEDVGIIAMEIYFPSEFVDQAELEAFDGVSSGKYTKGLGQTRMGFCSDREDVASLALTVVDRLMTKTGVGYDQIGRLEVGTETLIDKSKSVKSMLMQLFKDSGNSDVEGIDSTNACYGGTAALFNSVSWIESSAWDGRLAIAVCADIAVYATGPARPTGGAGAVAMLVGPNASLVLERGLRATHVSHEYDFYKPDLASEYPTVDGPLSIKCYLNALDRCYGLYKKKAAKADVSNVITLNNFDAVLFHSPFCKLVQKSLARLALNDFLAEPNSYPEDLRSKFENVALEDSYFNKDVEKAFMDYSRPIYEDKTLPSLMLATNVGNMYTPSLYGGLVSMIGSYLTADELVGKRIALFSYGSGLAASFYSLRIKDKPSLRTMHASLSEVKSRLESRSKISPENFAKTMKLREDTHHLAPYNPVGPVGALFPDTWYLAEVDDKHRRKYLKKSIANNGVAQE